MFEIMSDAGRPAIPAYITIRRRYGPHRTGPIRRAIMAKRAPMGQHVEGFKDPRNNQDEKMNLQAITNDERKMARVMGNRRPYRGSKLESDMRSGKGSRRG